MLILTTEEIEVIEARREADLEAVRDRRRGGAVPVKADHAEKRNHSRGGRERPSMSIRYRAARNVSNAAR